MAPPICPCCGSRLDPEAERCPECGADEQSGWTQAWSGTSAEWESGPFHYDKFIQREFGRGEPGSARWKPEGVSWFWWWTALAVLVLLGWLMWGNVLDVR
ncbi:MAG: hypothetical protein RMN51_09620 [Verrucomicrobiota bacterium]|nr:hypothetical protein [Limisphaera sp.]MDW8382349.1 hypothetical protein [Verrucomicrobiota bacterium]